MAKKKTTTQKKKTKTAARSSTRKRATTKAKEPTRAKKTTKAKKTSGQKKIARPKKATAKKRTNAAAKVKATKKPAAVKKASGKKKSAAKKPATRKKSPKKSSPTAQQPRREAVSRRSAKPEAPRRAGSAGQLPWSHGLDRVRALPVDPSRLFVYWEVTDSALENARERLGDREGDAPIALRLYDTTGRLFDGTNAHSHRDEAVERAARERFFDVGRPGSELFVELGVKASDGRFQKIARSRRVAFPRLAAPEGRPAEWMTVLTEAPRETRPQPPEPVSHTSERGQETLRHDPREHVASGPWHVEVPETRGERQPSGQWTLYRSWVVAEGRYVQGGERMLVTGSSERLGASERRFLGASELRLAGASERLLPGASERRLSQGGYPPIEGERAD